MHTQTLWARFAALRPSLSLPVSSENFRGSGVEGEESDTRHVRSTIDRNRRRVENLEPQTLHILKTLKPACSRIGNEKADIFMVGTSSSSTLNLTPKTHTRGPNFYTRDLES